MSNILKTFLEKASAPMQPTPVIVGLCGELGGGRQAILFDCSSISNHDGENAEQDVLDHMNEHGGCDTIILYGSLTVVDGKIRLIAEERQNDQVTTSLYVMLDGQRVLIGIFGLDLIEANSRMYDKCARFGIHPCKETRVSKDEIVLALPIHQHLPQLFGEMSNIKDIKDVKEYPNAYILVSDKILPGTYLKL